MNVASPDVASLRPPTSAIPPNPQNSVGTHSNFNNMQQQSIRPLGPPNVQTQNSGNIPSHPSQPRFMHGPGVQAPPLGGPPNNTPTNYSAVNGQGMRPQIPTAGIGPPQASSSKPFSPNRPNFSQNTHPVNGHTREHYNHPPMPSSVTQQSQMIPGTMNSNQPSVSQPHVGSHAGPANNSLYNQNNQMGMRPPAQSLQSTNSVQQNGVWQNHSTSIQPDSLNMQRPLDGVSGQHSTVTSPINTNQNTTNHTTASSNLQNLIPQSNTPQANLQSPLRGQSFMTTSSISPVSRPTNPNMLPNVLAPQNNIHGPRQTSSSIRQRYPNMMPPPMSTNQQPTMQTNLPPMSTSSLPQQNFGQSPPSGYPPTSSVPSSTQSLSTPPGFPPAPTSNQTIGGRPNHAMPQSMLATSSISQRIGGLSLSQGGEAIDLLQNRHILPARGTKIPVPKPKLQAELWNSYNCSSDIFRSTLTKIPETDNLLKKSRLPLGVLIHPFRDLSHLPVIQCATIVRCRQCRTYINPFVHFVDQRRWRCNICYRVNDLPEEFLYDPVSKSYGDPSRRPECKSATIEFIAPSEYMLRPPQPAVYIFLLDVSRQAVESGYINSFCNVLLEELDKLPGDSRTQVSFITYDRSVHFYSLPEGASQPTQLTVCDVDDVFLPSPTDILVNLQENNGLVRQLLEALPEMFANSYITESALGAALQAAVKLASPTGGRITVFQHILPTLGPGALSNRENTSSEKKNDASLLGPVTDFYKKLSLECSGMQVAVDLFGMGNQYIDIASLSGMSKHSGGQIQYFPGYHTVNNKMQAARFDTALRRYLTRKIGFEAVMRVRCTRGLTLHTFHGNFFVRSTDLLSLPNVNPDAGFGMQVSIEDDLRDSREVAFQAALLYTSSRGERRIRVHTLCLPTSASVSEIINGADQAAVVGMLAKFAADRATSDSVADAKEGLVVSCVDAAETFKLHGCSMSIPNGLLMPTSLRLLPLFVLACLRSYGFRNGVSLDERSFTFAEFKSLPLQQLLLMIYPDLYRVDDLSDDDYNTLIEKTQCESNIDNSDKEDQAHKSVRPVKVDDLSDDNENTLIEEKTQSESGDNSDNEDDKEAKSIEVRIPQPDRLQLSFERISATGMYLLDIGDVMYLYLSRGLHAMILERVFGVTRLNQVDETLTNVPDRDNAESEKLRTFIGWLNGNKPYAVPLRIIREDGKSRHLFVERMIEDRLEAGSMSYFEFLQHLKQNMKS